ncbi:uncharacterized protein LOC134750841 [Cydia strobilella]|uniref:uncharacterized protein LOC134750841 n=1 Tax=Cydia strobilella TaxID=1100964 RepID=UPI0030066041
MATTVLWLISLAFTIVICENVEQSDVIRRNHCAKGNKILNDCNWCRCKNSAYICEARNCNQVDMFGHFNDAIQDINVGMQGHGAWRSTPTACEPHVHYRRGSVLCVCGEDGIWPNPICRDVFQVLHAVQASSEKTCDPMKLYLRGCNVCFCPSTGQLDPELCTKKECDEDDPVMKERSTQLEESVDVYAECTVDQKYQLDCQTCTCLRNNRLLCGNCTDTKVEDRYYCHSEPPNKIFNVDCNLCFCDNEGRMVCSAKRCLGNVSAPTRRRLLDIDERYFELVERPVALHTCTIGTKYRKGCNTCVCLKHESGKTMFACTVRPCRKEESLLRTIREGCVLQTSYELNCLKCSCVTSNDEKWQWCETESICSNVKSESVELSSLRGYCEPLHNYVNDCNHCQCLSDSQTVICSDMKCNKASISVEIIPMLQHGSNCPKGNAYKVDCNICYCLLNGNSLCTTLDCKKE